MAVAATLNRGGGRRRALAEQLRLVGVLGAERRRIADELGTVVLDELRLVAGLASGLPARIAGGPTEPALVELQNAARRALAAMRRVLNVLHAADAGPTPGPLVPPRRWWELAGPGLPGLVLAAALTAGTLATAALGLRPTGVAVVDRLIDLLDLPLDRPVLLVVLAVQLAATAW